MTTLQQVELGVLGPLQVRQYGLPVAIPGAKPRAILTMLGLNHGSVVASDTLVELLWGDDPPRTAVKALQTHVSALRRTLGDGFVLTEGTGWSLSPATEADAARFRTAAKLGRDAMAAGDASQAVARFDEARSLWRGIPELPDGRRGVAEKTLWIEGHAALVEDRAEALLATGRAAEVIGELEAAIADAPLRERRWGQLMLALYRAGRQGEALGAYKRARALLADELGVDPGPDLRRLETAIVSQDASLEMPVAQQLSSVMRAVTFLLTDIEGSTVAWETDADAMAYALARHDEIVEQVVTFRGGRLVKTRGEGDATFSVFDRPSAAAAAAIELQEAIGHEPWPLADPMRIRIALHTGEVEYRDGDYFGRAVNRAARLRSLTAGGQTLCSGVTAELVIDSLADDVVLADLGMRQLKNLTRPEHVFELRLESALESDADSADAPLDRPELPAVLAGPGPFVGRNDELDRLVAAWQSTLAGGTSAVLIAGEPGVGKTRLAGEWSHRAYEQGAVVLYGRCDEDLGAPYQPFAEALRLLVPSLGTNRLRGLRGVEALLPMIPGLTEVLPDLAAAPRADPDTERYALFDAVVRLFGMASASAPMVLILDDLHWAAKPTLLLLRHLLRFGEHARLQIVGTYRSTDLDRSHPLAAMLADLHRDGYISRLALGGLGEDDVTAYVTEAGYDDEDLARALASVTGGNPFFLIEALRHVEESDGRWDPNTLPQGVREAVSRRLSRLPLETNKALAAAAVVGSRFSVDLVERVVGDDLLDAFDEACTAGIVIEEPGGRYRFNHAIVRQSLLAELASVRRLRLHQKIAAELETEPGADDELLGELAHHYFECAWSGNAGKAVEYCRRAADQAMARLAYEGAADLYDKAVHALEEIDDELPDRIDLQAELLVARCEALLAAGDVASATGAVTQLRSAAGRSVRLTAWGTCFDSQLSMMTDPERLDELESAVAGAAEQLAGLQDAAGEAKAHTVRAACLARLGRIGDAETALDQALTAARQAREHRRVNEVLAGAPLAALWGPNPVPRAGGRCLDVVRLLRITTGSPVVEATSTRCQGVLDAFRGRASAGRQLIDSARRSLTELGMRHALLEVDQFAGIVELVADDPAAAEKHLRKAYTGFRRMGIDADTAETAALLARACLALGRDAEADELCTESEHLTGHALKAAIAWRTVRAHLHSRLGNHGEARAVAEQAVAIAGRTDLLVDHGYACLALATVLSAAGDAAGARAAAERAIDLYEMKGAAALADRARRLLGPEVPVVQASSNAPAAEPTNACMRMVRELETAFTGEDWDQIKKFYAPDVSFESRRKIVGFTRDDLPSDDWPREAKRLLEVGGAHRLQAIAVRGERLALARLELGTADVSPGAPWDESIQIFALDEEGRLAIQLSFDVEDLDVATAELDRLHVQFEGERSPAAPLENTATRAADRLNEFFVKRRWDEFGAWYADELTVEDRRRGLRRESSDRAAEVANIRAVAELGIVRISTVPIALRGNRLSLSHVTLHGRDEFGAEALVVMEVDADERLIAQIALDPDDVDAAFAELDARYLAGEAAAHAHTWSVIVDTYAAFNQHEHDPSSVVNVDRRRVTRFEDGDLTAANTKGDTPNLRAYVETVHRLGDLGVVVTAKSRGTTKEGFEAEWRVVLLQTVDGDRMSRSEMFDEADLDAALVRFDELSRPKPRLQNAASQVAEQYLACFATRDWAAMQQLLADDAVHGDRRGVVNVGVRHGRDVQIADMRAVVEVGFESMTQSVTATRGERLALTRVVASTRGTVPGEFGAEMLGIVEISADHRITGTFAFDLDQVDAAFAELDSRYLAGEAAEYAHTWSLIAGAYAAFNRREVPAATPDWVNADHRRGAAVAPGDMVAFLRASLEETSDVLAVIKAVHRLSNLGAVVSFTAQGVSHADFEAEWRAINVMTFDGDLMSNSELFDDTELDAALARFDEFSCPAIRLDNTANQVTDRFLERFAARDWAAMAQMVATDISFIDRRRVVNADLQVGRDLFLENFRAAAELGATQTSNAIAIRGDRVVLARARFARGDGGPEEFGLDLLHIIEIDAGERVVATVTFDPDDFDAAIVELDARYLAGEAAANASAWSVVTRNVAAFNRHEFPAWTPDAVSVDHRRVTAFAAGDQEKYVRATWEQTPDMTIYIESVHHLSDRGAVFTYVATGTSKQGFDAEWRAISLSFFDGDLITRSERFDEGDLDAALARFDELSRPATCLENTASRTYRRYVACWVARDWEAMAETIVDDIWHDDRRRTIGSSQRGRDAVLTNMRAVARAGGRNIEFSVMATRGDRLALGRTRVSGDGIWPDAMGVEVLNVVEVDADGRFAAGVAFDPDDRDAAFDELESRYLAGEAAAHARTWSVILRIYAELRRHTVPQVASDCVNVDHRRGIAFAPGDLTAYVKATLEHVPDFNMRIETVHRLTGTGAVVTFASSGTSREGFDAEWRMVLVMAVSDNLMNHCEIFDEADLDAALARLDEIRLPAAQLSNAASRTLDRYLAHFVTGDWGAMAEALAADHSSDDRRSVVSAGVLHGRDAEIANYRVAVELGITTFTPEVIAIRGERLVLARVRLATDRQPDSFEMVVLGVTEINADGEIAASVVFDLDDIDAAFAELDDRYLAGEASAHAGAWSVVSRAYSGVIRHERPNWTADFRSMDHRKAIAFAPGELAAYVDAIWDDTPGIRAYVEVVHRMSDVGVLVTHVSTGTSDQGFDAEWRTIALSVVDGDQISRCEIFDEDDLDAAIARFDELNQRSPKLENAASRATARFGELLAVRDWDGMATIFVDEIRLDDRRRLVGAEFVGRQATIANMKASADTGVRNVTARVVAARGERLTLQHIRINGKDQRPEAFRTEALVVTEVDGLGRITAFVMFDIDDFDAAIAELTARWIASGEVAHPEVIEAQLTFGEIANRHHWEALTEMHAGAPYVNHRQLASGVDTVVDDMSSLRMLASLVPDLRFELAEVLAYSARGVVNSVVVTGTSTEGMAVEIPWVTLQLFDGDRVIHVETFDADQRELALVRFEELNRAD